MYKIKSESGTEIGMTEAPNYMGPVADAIQAHEEKK